MQKCLKAFFSGRVQGVGFRFAAERAARRFPVKGYVRNLPDGRVELVAEGEESVVKEFLDAVTYAMATHIHVVKTSWSDAEGKYRQFGIAY